MNKKEWKETIKMEEKKRFEELTEIFRKYGANDPELWAHSAMHETPPHRINQLARFSLLKALTSEVLKDRDVEWVNIQLGHIDNNEGAPLSQLAPAIKEMIDKGVSKEAVIDLVRVIQYETLFHVLMVLEGETNVETPVNRWAVFEKDENDNPTKEIHGLHESLLGFDPSDREFRPRLKEL